MRQIIIHAAQLVALVPVSSGAVMHRLATRPHLAAKLHYRPQSAQDEARREVLERHLSSPVPADRWMRELYRQIEQGVGKSLTDIQRRALCVRALGDAVGRGHDLTVRIEGPRLAIFAGSHPLVRLTLPQLDGAAS